VYVSACCSSLQCVAVWYSVLQFVAVHLLQLGTDVVFSNVYAMYCVCSYTCISNEYRMYSNVYVTHSNMYVMYSNLQGMYSKIYITSSSVF